ncbi:NAD(P)H-hydrate dehydratase [Halobacillus sp. B29]|uniref:NAD(P)H-hydrate dehydratase n=1 Tax=Halobacillus sp. B29 TaxID=3457432 RepID=UPI003FCCFF14
MDIVTAQEMYERDRVAIESTGIDGKMLMESAGRAAAEDLEHRIKRKDQVIVLIGSGNNGGDGFVIARTLLNRGYKVEAWQVVPDEKISGDAEAHRDIFKNSGFELKKFSLMEEFLPSLYQASVIIDAMLGIGIEGRLRSPLAEIVEKANEHKALRLAIDLPTGLPAGEGVDNFDAFNADYTTIIATPKISVFLQHTSPYYGEWSVVEIGLPVKKLPEVKRFLWSVEDVEQNLPQRDSHSHKGSHGKGVMAGGSYFMPGSIAMAARAALRSGTGLLTIATAESIIPSVTSYVQEATFSGLEEEEGMITGQAIPELSKYDGAAIGMGLGRHEEAAGLVLHMLQECKGPLLIDADGLYVLKPMLAALKNRSLPTVVTPHPGEFAYLAGISIQEILQSPFRISREFASEYGVYLVLKGPYTIITAPDGEQRVDMTGNAGLAKGGSGDVLSGILFGMMLQSDNILDALSNGCVIHGSTADYLIQEEHSKTDLLASDLVEGLSHTFRTFSASSKA